MGQGALAGFRPPQAAEHGEGHLPSVLKHPVVFFNQDALGLVDVGEVVLDPERPFKVHLRRHVRKVLHHVLGVGVGGVERAVVGVVGWVGG